MKAAANHVKEFDFPRELGLIGNFATLRSDKITKGVITKIALINNGSDDVMSLFGKIEFVDEEGKQCVSVGHIEHVNNTFISCEAEAFNTGEYDNELAPCDILTEEVVKAWADKRASFNAFDALSEWLDACCDRVELMDFLIN